MATLTNIPPEITLLVAESLNPKDAFRFAAIDRNTWQICASLIATHKDLAQKYGFICPTPDDFTMWKLLDELSVTPRVADYVLELELNMDKIFYFDPRHRWHNAGIPSVRPSLQDVDRYLKVANGVGFLHNSTIAEDLRHTIEMGYTDPIVVIALNQLHALDKLRMIPCSADMCLQRGLQELVAACVQSTYISHSHGPFENLKKVQLSHDDTEGCSGWEWAVVFTRLPNLEYFSAHMLGGSLQSIREDQDGLHDGMERWAPAKSPTSNLKTLLLSSSMVSREVIGMILSNCKALETFEYDNGGASISWDAEYDPRGIMHSVTEYCSHSLTRLVLKNMEEDESIQELNDDIRAIPDLRGMKQLQVLRCQYSDLVEDEQSDTEFIPSDILPQTLEGLHLDPLGTCDDSQRLRVLEKLIKSRDGALPYLTLLFLENTYNPKDDGHSVREKLAIEHGMKYESVETSIDGLYKAFGSMNYEYND